ncbi:MAG TPA: hypothetical protein PLS49_05420 [Candidatus Woesebacteria bacterium]|nr:hypothetical protein [Candidatus Woesebacteria bacterium]
MLKKITILLAIFGFAFVANIYLVSRIYATTERQTNIAIILEELDNIKIDTTSIETAEYFMDAVDKDQRVAVLKAFFRKHDSPLYDHAEFVVKTADEYGLDYRLIPAISMQESGACKVIPNNSYNCWGWGIYGGTITRFSSYPEAIETVSRGLKKYYLDEGLTTPEQIMSKYNPSSTGSWSFGVNYFLNGM